jgi:hypothetical protein
MLENKIVLNFENDNPSEEIKILLSDIYRNNFAKLIDNPCEKYINNIQIFKKNLNNEKNLRVNLVIVKFVLNKINEYFKVFSNRIVNNPNYNTFKTTLKEFVSKKNKTEMGNKSFFDENQKYIDQIFTDINVIYKGVLKAATEIENIFSNSLELIYSEYSVYIKFDNYHKNRIKKVLLSHEFISVSIL